MNLPTPTPTKPGKKNKNGSKPQSVSPQVLAQLAVDRAIALAGKPGLNLAPARVGLTGLATYYWIAPPPRRITAQAAVPGLTVTARATPVRYLWRFGEGTQKTTSGPGRRWTRLRSGNISHVYQARGRYQVSVQVLWQAVWRIGGGPWRILGTFATTAGHAFPVRQAVALLTKS